MVTSALSLVSSRPISLKGRRRSGALSFSSPSPSQLKLCPATTRPTSGSKSSIWRILLSKNAIAATLGVGIAFNFVGSGSAAELSQLGASMLLNEPPNALSLPTWAIHVSSVVEWVTAMVLVWQYGEKSGLESWKGMSWGMVPLLGGALCACTWHFFYNSKSLEVLVALQAALTVIGNATMCLAAFRIYRSSEKRSKNL